MKNHLDNYFYYTKRERNGLLVLLILMLVFLATPTLFRKVAPVKNYTFPEIKKANISPPLALLEDVPTAIDEARPIDPNLATTEDFLALGLSEKTTKTILNYRNKGGRFFKPADLKKIYGLSLENYNRILPNIFITKKEKANTKVGYNNSPKAVRVKTNTPASTAINLPTEKFNPNTISKEELTALGLPEKVVNVMANFRKSGGKFYKADDLLHVYGMKESWLEQLAPWIDIPPTKKFDAKTYQKKTKKPEKKPNPITDINTATYEEWQQLSGIGPYYADKLVTYREKLGGFHSVEQIKETFGLPDSVKQSILPDLRLSPIFRQLNINTMTAKELVAHPYIKWKQANLIVNYRTQHGPYQSTADLKKILGLKTDFLDRISPYLSEKLNLEKKEASTR